MACSGDAVIDLSWWHFKGRQQLEPGLPGAAAISVLQLGIATASLPANGLPPFLIIKSQMVQKSVTAYQQ